MDKKKWILALIGIGLLFLLGTTLATIYFQNSIQNTITVNDYNVILSEYSIDWGTVNPGSNISHTISLKYDGNLASVFIYLDTDINIVELGYLTCDRPQGYELVAGLETDFIFTLHTNENAKGSFNFNIYVNVGDS